MPRMSEKPEPQTDAVEPATTEDDAPKVDSRLDGPDNEWVRVRHPRTGDLYSTTRALARNAGATLMPDHDALDRYGRPLPRVRRNDRGHFTPNSKES